MTTYDVVVVGSGPGGYVAAIRCAQLGMKTAIVEKYAQLGGTCLNVGCIPSKALLDSSEHFHKAKHEFETHGIKVDKLSIDFGQMIKRKAEVVKQTVAGVEFLMKKNKIDCFQGVGSFKSANELTVNGKKKQQLAFKKCIIATGSKPAELPFLKLDKKRIISSTEALSLSEIPKKIIIIGGGIIGLELGSVYNRLGSEVSIIEYMDKIIPGMDSDLGKELSRILRKQGVNFNLSHKVKGAVVKGKKVIVSVEDKKGALKEFEGDYCLLSVGRRPYTEGLDLESIGVELDERGRIPVNKHLQTKHEHIYAIGDVIEGPMLAHKAEDEGVMVAEFMAGQKPHIDYNLIPGVAYTWPEVAAVGKTEQELKEAKKAYKSGKFPFKASGRARASMDADGFIKVLADEKTDEILGVHMIGPRMADLIMEAVTAMEYRASAEDIVRMCHPHPTYSEAFKEACLAATEDRALHI